MADELHTCKHGIYPSTACSSCKAQSMPTVYISGGGMKYHATPSCPALAEGQSKAANPEPILPVSLGSEVAQSRKPCKTCRPPRV